jgi:hypothetical protein
VHTFYQPLFSNSPLAIPLQQFFSLQQSSFQPFIFPLQESPSSTFPSAIHFSPFSNLFPFQSLPHQKASLHPKAKSLSPLKSQKPKAKNQSPKAQKQKALCPPSRESFIPSGKQGGGATALWEGCDIVTRKTCELPL